MRETIKFVANGFAFDHSHARIGLNSQISLLNAALPPAWTGLELKGKHFTFLQFSWGYRLSFDSPYNRPTHFTGDGYFWLRVRRVRAWLSGWPSKPAIFSILLRLRFRAFDDEGRQVARARHRYRTEHSSSRTAIFGNMRARNGLARCAYFHVFCLFFF